MSTTSNSLTRWLCAFSCAALFAGLHPGAGATLISRAIIDPNEAAAPRFALDNLMIDSTTLRFDEVATQPVDGLTVNGITFSFSVGGAPSLDALYNAPAGPGDTALFQAPPMEGDAAGLLQLDFAAPTSSLTFDLALFSVGFVGVGGTVELFDTSLAQIGPALPINVILPQTGLSEGRFSVSVPEPATPALVALGLIGVGLVFARRSAGVHAGRRRWHRAAWR